MRQLEYSSIQWIKLLFDYSKPLASQKLGYQTKTFLLSR
uniref:Uncharacterized protein n=1 Tax=Anguilla anguilla TaxID=7936 RepID=A0A0E9QUT5_ANGAN